MKPNANSCQLTVDLSHDGRLETGRTNRIEFFAYNAEGYLKSRSLSVEFEPPGEKLVDPPQLWAVVAGVSDYRGTAIDLRYAAKDAGDFANAVRIAGNRLFGEARVHVTLLTTNQDHERRPSRDNLIQALKNLRATAPDDLLVVYLAGHGVAFGDEQGEFYFLTDESANANLSDPSIRQQTTVSSAELAEYLRLIPAQKQVLVLDTCSAGRLIDNLTESRNVPSSQIRALERVKDRTGMHILAGCAADAVSYEASRYGQGVLTYSLLLGMRGAALDENGTVDVMKLFGFAVDQVPGLAQNVGGIQRPVVTSPRGGQSFAIGLVTDEDRAQIPLQPVFPLVLRSSFQEQKQFDDVLKLGRAIDEVLLASSIRGDRQELVFVDATQVPDAYRLVGRYRVQRDEIAVDAYVFHNRNRIGSVSLKGLAGNLDELARRVVAEVQTLIGVEEIKRH